MVLIKRITAVVTAFALAAVMQGASLTAFSEGDVSEAEQHNEGGNRYRGFNRAGTGPSITRTKGCLWHR